MIYGLLLILFIIYMPKGILGTGTDWWRRWRKPAPSAQGGGGGIEPPCLTSPYLPDPFTEK